MKTKNLVIDTPQAYELGEWCGFIFHAIAYDEERDLFTVCVQSTTKLLTRAKNLMGLMSSDEIKELLKVSVYDLRTVKEALA